MSESDGIAVSLLLLVTFVAVLIRISSCSGEPAGSPPPATVQAAASKVVIAGDSVNLRQEPARSAAVLAQAQRGQELELLNTQTDWYNVKWGERTAWLSKLYASPTEDCSTEQAAAAEPLRHKLTGVWKGEVLGRPATFVFYTRQDRLCAYVVYVNVKEVLEVEETGPSNLTLTGKKYERLAGAANEYWLDKFFGQVDEASGRLAGTLVDARNNQGRWFAERVGSSSEAALSTRPASEQSNPLSEASDKGEGVLGDQEESNSGGSNVSPPAISGTAAASGGPSFDCTEARSRSEHLVCSSSELAVLDLSMSNAYHDAVARLGTKERKAELRSLQNNWLKEVRESCFDVACLKGIYEQRIRELNAMTR